jgi:cytochrome c oxidase cbb3-type subunit 1
VVWGIVGMLVGVIIAAQLRLARAQLRHSLAQLRPLRPLHTNAVIFAFGGCALFATSYYVVQRTCQTRCSLPGLAPSPSGAGTWSSCWRRCHLPLGYTTGKEYAELEWPIDILIAVVWVAYAVVFFGTIGKRKVRHIYVANWFFGAFIMAVALLHIVNSAAIPVSLTKVLLGLRRRAGRHGAVVVRPQRGGLLPDRRLPGHDVLLHPQAGRRPVYSYRLSIVHFWALIFTYMWAGPHHLHYTALPDWAQSSAWCSR